MNCDTSLTVSNFRNKLQAKIFLQVKALAGKHQHSSSRCEPVLSQRAVRTCRGCRRCCPPARPAGSRAALLLYPVERKPQTRRGSEDVLTKRGRANVPLLPPIPGGRPVRERDRDRPQSCVCWSDTLSTSPSQAPQGWCGGAAGPGLVSPPAPRPVSPCRISSDSPYFSIPHAFTLYFSNRRIKLTQPFPF